MSSERTSHLIWKLYPFRAPLLLLLSLFLIMRAIPTALLCYGTTFNDPRMTPNSTQGGDDGPVGVKVSCNTFLATFVWIRAYLLTRWESGCFVSETETFGVFRLRKFEIKNYLKY